MKKRTEKTTTFVVRISKKTKKILNALPWGKRGYAVEKLLNTYEKELKKFAA